MRVLMLPHLSQISGNRTTGIDQVVTAYARHLPEFGIELVSPDAESYDLIASHAGLTGPVNDVCHLHGLHWSADYDAPDWEYRVNARIVEAVRHAKVITVPSEWVAETIRRDLRVNPAIIPHGIDWADWQHDEPQGDYILWNKNRSDPWICDPMPVVHLAHKFPKAHFVTTFLPDKMGPANNTNVIGLIPHAEMKKLVQSALVYVATTPETFGIGILEAMAAGVPVLGYAHGGILDLVGHGTNGYLARPGDIDDLAEGLTYCVKHRQVLGENGREMARAWTWEVACARVAEVYQQAAVEEPPTVGVVIPVFNKTEQELRRAIESVINQTHQPQSITIVDDGSDNEAAIRAIVEGYQRQSGIVHYLRQTNSGVAIARNRGIDHTDHTKYAACLDADDWIAPDFIRICVNALEADRSLGIAYTGLYYHKPDGTHGVSPWPSAWDYDKQLQRQNQIPTCCVFRRAMWERLGGYRQRYAPKGAGSEDAEFWTRAGAYGWKAAKVTEEALFHYSWMSGQVTSDPNYHEVDWLAYHPWSRDGQHPFASYATPKRYSHPVRAYDRPAISVIIPVGPGHEREVINALDSLEAQTFRQWEAIVVWDVPKSQTAYYEFIEDFKKAYPYIKTAWSAGYGKPGGAGHARNLGAKYARAPFLVFLDADDWLYPEALQKMINAWNAHQAIVYTDYVGKAYAVDISKLSPKIEIRHYFKERDEYVMGYKPPDFDCARAMQQPELPQPFIWCNVTALVPKVWHDEIGGFDESMSSWEDVDYHWRHARAGHCYYHLPEELMVYRFYTGSRRDKGLQDHKNLVQYLTEKYERDGDIMGCSGCPGGGRAKATTTSAPAVGAFASSPRGGMKLAATPGNDDNFIRVKIVDGKRGSHPIVGSTAINPMTGRKFDYGMRSDGDVILVHRDDVYMVDRRSGQQTLRDPRRFQPIEERVIEPPPSGPKVTPAPEPIAASSGIATGGDMQEPSWVWERDLNDNPLDVETSPIAKSLPFDFQTLPGVNVNIAAALKALGLESREDILKFGVEGLTTVRGIGEVKAKKIVEYLSRE